MRIHDWKYYAPETEAGTAEPTTPAAVPGGDGAGSGGGEGREPVRERRSVRQSLEGAFEDARKAEAEAGRVDRGDGRDAQGRLLPGHTVRRSKEAKGAETEEDTAAEPAAGDMPATATGTDAGAAPAAVGEAPAAWTKEAKAEWGKLPEAARAAVLKREADVQKGVDALKAGYAEVDRALAPHAEVIRRHGLTPGAAVERLFLWFGALANNPREAFPALAKSFNFDLASVAPASAPSAGVETGAVAPAGDLTASAGALTPEAVQQLVDRAMMQRLQGLEQTLGQRLSGLESGWAAQSQKNTEEILAQWAKDKPHFEAVRQEMANLIGTGAIPTLANGRIDLDGAYERAIWGLPEVRGKVLTEMEAKKAGEAKAKAEARAKAAEAEAAKARQAAVSVVGTAPGGAEMNGARRREKGKTVKDSLKEAIEELRS